jgi:hypothetical protein
VADLLVEVRRHEVSDRLDDRQKAALRFHDAFLVDPAGLSSAVRDEVLACYSPGQIVELAFKFVFWSTNRPRAAIGPDAPHDPARIRTFRYADDGEYLVDPAP